MATPRTLCATFALCVQAACGGSVPRPREAITRTVRPAEAWRYAFELDRALAHVRASVCFDSPPPRRLVAGSDAAMAVLEHPTWVDAAGTVALHTDSDGIVLDAATRAGCVRYTARLDLPDGALGQAGARARGATRGIVASSNTWLWFPDAYAPGASATATVRAPDGVFVSLPWPRARDGSYRVDATAFEREGYLAASVVATQTVALPGGAELDLVGIGGPLAPGAADVRPWLVQSASDVATLFGGFVAPHAQLMLLGQRGAREPVPFAFTSHAGGDAVLFFVDPDATAAAIAADSTAVHEFVHLSQPVVRDGDTWIAEGFATYYETVLRVRAGQLDAAAAWQLFEDGFARGRADQSGRTLAADSAAIHRDRHYGRVYWAGVAFALLGDVALRRESSGALSLDDMVRALRSCCYDRRTTWSADQLAGAMDRAAGRAIFAPLATRLEGSTDFPDLAPTYAALGIRVNAGRVALDDAAPSSAIRRAIVATANPP